VAWCSTSTTSNTTTTCLQTSKPWVTNEESAMYPHHTHVSEWHRASFVCVREREYCLTAWPCSTVLELHGRFRDRGFNQYDHMQFQYYLPFSEFPQELIVSLDAADVEAGRQAWSSIHRRLSLSSPRTELHIHSCTAHNGISPQVFDGPKFRALHSDTLGNAVRRSAQHTYHNRIPVPVCERPHGGRSWSSS
jgi:hypothetical protein